MQCMYINAYSTGGCSRADSTCRCKRLCQSGVMGQSLEGLGGGRGMVWGWAGVMAVMCAGRDWGWERGEEREKEKG